MRKLLLPLTAASVLFAPGLASAQSTTATKTFAVVGNVPAMCAGGAVTGGNSTFDLGVLADTTTGLLRTDLAAPSKVITGSFCSTRSTISVAATAIAAQNSTATPPAGFSRSVNYVASASGWTTTPASFDTASTTNAAATQTRATAFTGDITVGIGGFSTAGGNTLRLIADSNYSGQVTVTLAAAN